MSALRMPPPMSPKRFSRIARFQIARDAKRIAPNLSWLTIAHESGYYAGSAKIRDGRSAGSHGDRRLPRFGSHLDHGNNLIVDGRQNPIE